MTDHGAPPPPFPTGGQGYGPPSAYGPPGTYGPAGPGGPGTYGPPPGARPAAPLWPIIVVTIFFALFGLIPTIIASNRASERRESTGRYWLAFGLSLFASIVLYVVLTFVLVFVVLAAGVTAVGSAIDRIPSVAATATAPTTAGTDGNPVTTGPCGYRSDGTAAELPDDPDPTPTTPVTWTVVTSAGTVVMELDAAAAPCTVQSIEFLTDNGFYDDTVCPRSVDEGIFILQCGDPTGTGGAGGPGYSFDDENLAGADYRAGAVAMANAGANTNGSQFFIVDKDANGALPKDYTVFGTVTSGLDVVDKIVAAGNDGSSGSGGGRPKTEVRIISATTS